MTFTAGAGTVSRLTVHPEKKNEAAAALVEIACAKPASPQGRRGD
jgi:hypothetical protein